MKKRICGLLASLITLSMFSACNSGASGKVSAAFSLPNGFDKLDNKMICENDNYLLAWDEVYKKVTVTDKKNNYSYSTTPNDANDNGVDEFGFPIEATPRVNSPIILKYINPKTKALEQSVGYTQSVKRGNIDVELLNGGICVTYYFEDEEISVPVEYKLKDNGLSISIDPKNIKEGKNKLYSVELAPYLCALKNSTGNDKNRYLFVPSGSGALIYPKTISGEGTYYGEDVYGRDYTKQVFDKISNTNNINLPVYGYKDNNSGGLVIIDKGAEHAKIGGYIGSGDIGYSNIGAEFILRGSDDIKPSQFSANSSVRSVFADSLVQDTVGIFLYPLCNEEANYNSMAEIYRNYLAENGNLPKSSTDNSVLHLKFYGATYVDKTFLGIPYKALYSLTSVKDADKIVSEISDKTDIKLSVELNGYGSSGIDTGKIAGDYQISSKLGSKEELLNFQDKCLGNNMSFYYDFDILSFSKSGNSWSYGSDVPKGPTGLKSYQYFYDTAVRSSISDKEYALLSRTELLSSADKLLSKTKNLKLKGIGIDKLSYIAYSDYRDIKYYSKGNMAEDVTKIVNSLKKNNYKILSSNANSYAAGISNEITDVPLQSSGNDVFAVDIPFYQMVFKGSVSLTSVPINLTQNPADSVIKAMESGCGITYSLISNYDTGLVASLHKELHSSVYSGIKEELIKTADKTAEFYKQIDSSKIASYEIISEDVRKTVFDNGLVLYTNHGKTANSCEFGEIEPYGFLYKKGGEQ